MRLTTWLFFCCSCAFAQPGVAFQSRGFADATISPNGHYVTYAETLRAPNGADSSNTKLFLLDRVTAGAKAKQITAGKGDKPCSERSVAWSPDSQRAAFLSNCGDGKQNQIYLVPAAGGSPRKLTTLTGFLQNIRWSPDGNTIAVLFTENAIRLAGAVEATTPDAGVVEEKFYEQRLTLIDAGSGKARKISPEDTYVYEYDWSPDGKQIAYTAAKGSGDNNWWVAELFRINVQSAEIARVLKPEAQIAVPRWSPDGQTIAFIGGIMSDEGSTGGDVYTISASGGSAKDITPGRKTSPGWLRWLSDQKLVMTERVDGGAAVTTLDLKSGTAETLWKADESIRAGSEDLSLSLAQDGKTAAVVRNSWSRAPELWAGSIGDWKPVTQFNTGAKPAWGEAKKLHWPSDGETVQGWLIYPKDYDPSRRYAMIVSVHGGPASMKSPSWPGNQDYSHFSEKGYFVLFPNPRGSYGTGEAFTKANVKDFGYGDLKDILAGVDEVVKTLPVDEKRIGIGGWSYGGYMTMWAVTQTNRFAAAVAGAGIANWQSYYGENSIDEWMLPYFGASVYDDPTVYAKSSPITFIKNVKTPTLVVVGDRDGECPAPQSYEFWHALKANGVKTKFIVYPGEGHHFRDPKHVEDLSKQTAAWFEENLK